MRSTTGERLKMCARVQRGISWSIRLDVKAQPDITRQYEDFLKRLADITQPPLRISIV